MLKKLLFNNQSHQQSIEDQGTELQALRDLRIILPEVVSPVKEAAPQAVVPKDANIVPTAFAAPAAIVLPTLTPTQKIQNAELRYPGKDFYHLVFDDANTASECSVHIGSLANKRWFAQGVHSAPRVEIALLGHPSYPEGTPYLRVHKTSINAVASTFDFTAKLTLLNSSQVVAQTNSQVAP